MKLVPGNKKFLTVVALEKHLSKRKFFSGRGESAKLYNQNTTAMTALLGHHTRSKTGALKAGAEFVTKLRLKRHFGYLIAPGVCLAMLIDHLNEREKGVRPADMVKLRAAIKLQNGNITKTDNRTGLAVNLIDDEITSVDVEDDDFLSEDD